MLSTHRACGWHQMHQNSCFPEKHLEAARCELKPRAAKASRQAAPRPLSRRGVSGDTCPHGRSQLSRDPGFVSAAVTGVQRRQGVRGRGRVPVPRAGGSPQANGALAACSRQPETRRARHAWLHIAPTAPQLQEDATRTSCHPRPQFECHRHRPDTSRLGAFWDRGSTEWAGSVV